MKQCTVKILLVLGLASMPLYAVSGIGVANINYDYFTSRSLTLFKVTNSHVDTSYNLVTSAKSGEIILGHPVINTHGTHLAYVMNAGTWNVPQCRIRVMRLSNPLKTIDLALFGLDCPGGAVYAAGDLAWPQGDWIYFVTDRYSRYIYKVNVQTRKVEFVVRVANDSTGNFGREFKMSALGEKVGLAGGLYFTIKQAQDQNGVIKGTKWSAGGGFTVQGCGHTISPSGNVMSNQVDPGHFGRIVTPLNWTTHTLGTSVSNMPADRNGWSTDRTDTKIACTITDPITGEPIVETIGVGNSTYGSSFAVNSDKWEALQSGWAPDGREGGNGMNTVLVNYTDKIAMNVTRSLRRNNPANTERVEPLCTVITQWVKSDEGTFFVSAPESDILPELLNDSKTDYKIPGLDDNTQVAALTMLPKTPAAGYPIGVIESRKDYSSFAGPLQSIRSFRNGATQIALSASNASLHYSVTLFNAHGAKVLNKNCVGSTVLSFATYHLNPGMYLLKVDHGVSISTAQIPLM